MAFKTKNLNYAFNVEYYGMTDFKKSYNFDRENRDLVQIKSDGSNCYRAPEQMSFRLQTGYPGLLVGVGNVHGYGGEGDIGLGFSFDYVTGMPYIPGSSVKGILRSAFAHIDYIKGYVGESVDVAALEKEIFCGLTGGKDGCEQPVPLRDTFYDAFPETKGRLMAMEAITPHADELKKPNPISLVKVKPNVIYKFSFRLADGIITKQAKLELFKNIIKDLGAGAKTNVGFGSFAEVSATAVFSDSEPVPANTQESCSSSNQRGGFNRSSGGYHKSFNPNNTKITCRDCGKEYILNDFEEKQTREAGWKIVRCRDCQRARKQNS